MLIPHAVKIAKARIEGHVEGGSLWGTLLINGRDAVDGALARVGDVVSVRWDNGEHDPLEPSPYRPVPMSMFVNP